MKIGPALEELCAGFNAHDLDRIMAMFTDDCVLEMPRGDKPWGARSEGKENVQRAIATRLSSLPDVHYGNVEHFVDDAKNTGVSRWTITGTRQDGKKIEANGCDFYMFRDGKVVCKDSYWKIVE
jgi:ketosteroid isomerase-like protein